MSFLRQRPLFTGAPYHSHNCDEHVTLLEGLAEVEIEGVGAVEHLSPADAMVKD